MTEHRQAKGRLGGDVDHVRVERVNRPPDLRKRRQRQAELPVEGHPYRTHKVDVLPVGGLAVVRMHELDLVAPLFQVADELAQGPRDSVDLGKVRLGDQADSHRGPRACQPEDPCFPYFGWYSSSSTSPGIRIRVERP